MTDVLTTVNKRRTPQTEQADPRQVKNAAGGFVFTIDDWALVHRFLTIGTFGGTFYQSAEDLTKDAAEVVLRAAATDAIELVRRIVAVSEAGRAPDQKPALFALAIAASADDVEGRQAALAALPRVARTGTHLFLFARYVEQFRGWGRALSRAVGNWYTARGATTVAIEEAEFQQQNRTNDVASLAYQLAKYRQREGWTHADMLRLSHPSTRFADPTLRMVLNWAVGKGLNDYAHKPRVLTVEELAAGERTLRRAKLPRVDNVPAAAAIIADFEDAQAATDTRQWIEIINRRNGLSWEMLPDAALTVPAVWEALLHAGIPQNALIRQLPRLTRLGLAVGQTGRFIATQLQDPQRLKRARVHPINLLVGLRTYASGRSARGDSTWTPSPLITDGFDAAFYVAYDAVEPANKRTLLALDISGSMGHPVAGKPLTCREVAGALAMVTAATEPDYRIVGFTGVHGPNFAGRMEIKSNTITEMDISPRRRLDDVCRHMSELPMGWTDCALPFTWATQQREVFDTVIIVTDSESYAGPIHVHQALRRYREKVNPATRLVVMALTGTRHSIADPTDTGSLDISGLDSAAPNLIAAFSRGDI